MKDEIITKRKTLRYEFILHDQLLYRQVLKRKSEEELFEKQLVVPAKYRTLVLQTAHDTLLSGHLGITKTLARVKCHFFWVGMDMDVTRYCCSCDICQKTVPKGQLKKGKLENMPIITVPFQRVAVDIIGPLFPTSKRGKKYILTMVDVATRYPQAAALSIIDSETVTEALISMFSNCGIPNEILTDRGTQFTSKMMQEVHRLLSIKSVTTTPYHAQCNGLCEKYNGTLKAMLKRMIGEQPAEWDQFLEPLLFAYREAPISSLGGFSPFEVLYGRSLRGPTTVLREVWANENLADEEKTVYDYVLDLRNRLEETCKITRKELENAQQKMKVWFDRKAGDRNLKTGDQVLLLLPCDNNKLLIKWKGPFQVKRKLGRNDYCIDINGKEKTFHINMLKRYYVRENAAESENVATAVVYETSEDSGIDIETIDSSGDETYRDAHINNELTKQQKEDLLNLLEEYQDVFSSKPGCTDLAEHSIILTDQTPIKRRPYPIPYNMYPQLRSEIDDMLKMDIIEVSDSPYCSPIIMLKKKDGTIRTVADMRKVNKITVFDSESMPDPQAIFAKIAGSKVYSKLDCCKGYWQVPMKPEHRQYTAFSNPFGNYQFKMMPFGLVNAGATYNRMMRKLLKNVENVESFVDDILAYSTNWSNHLETLQHLFKALKDAHLTVKLSKCFLGFNQLDYIGHKISEDSLSVQNDKVEKVKNAPIPKTKRELRSFLGLTNYYRSFVPSFADKSLELTNLTKKGSPNKLPWKDIHSHEFNQLKAELTKAPILKLPDMSKRFTIRTDASNTGLGAILMQDHDGILFPVSYISKKLLPRETNYATVEKECYAIVWAIGKFQSYLLGNEFTLQTDHKPLTYLDKAKHNNHRLMRWTLSLQPYSYIVEAIKGSDNIGSDYLSRQ